MEQTDIKQQIETMIADEQYRPLSLAQLQETLGLSTTEEFIAMNKAANASENGWLLPRRPVCESEGIWLSGSGK